jgi:chemotaxis protein CheY-P-specific phosphatase CheC
MTFGMDTLRNILIAIFCVAVINVTDYKPQIVEPVAEIMTIEEMADSINEAMLAIVVDKTEGFN